MSGFTEFSCDNRYKKVYKVHQDVCFKERCQSTSLKKLKQVHSRDHAVMHALLWVGRGSTDRVGRLFAQKCSPCVAVLCSETSAHVCMCEGR